MKKRIGGILIGAVVLILFLMTCNGPNDATETGPSTASTSAPEAEQRDTPPTPETAAPPLSATAAVPSVAATPVSAPPAPTPEKRLPEARTAPVSSASPVPTAATAPGTESPSKTAASSLPVFVVPTLPVAPIPTEGIEALLAVSPTENADGTTSGVVLIPADSLRRQLRLPVGVDRVWMPTDYTRGQPSSTINTPTAYGQKWGDVYGGVGYQNRIRYDDWRDGVASIGMGLGNPTTYVGIDVALNILDTYTEFGKDRSLSLKVHRQLPYRTAIAVGHENIWHTDGTDGGSSRYVVVSKVMLFRDRPTSSFGSMVVNMGLGNDRFLSEDAFMQGDNGVNAFGSVGLRLLRPVNAVANWTGQDLALGLSIAPVRTWPLVITPAVMDVTGTAGDGARFSVSAGLNYNFRR